MEIKKSEQNSKIAFNTLRINMKIYHTYLLLYRKGQVQIRSRDSTINVETKNNRVNKLTNIALNTLRIYIIIHHTYQLLYCKGNIQIRSRDNTINVETKR